MAPYPSPAASISRRNAAVSVSRSPGASRPRIRVSSRRRHPVRRPLLGIPDWLVGEVGDTSFKGLGGEEAHGFRSAGLILRDVLGFHASEVASMLDSTVESVTSALKRARASLRRRLPPATGQQPPPTAGSPAEEATVAKFVSAWESADLDALVALATDDVFVSMPPMPFEYEGRDVVARFCAALFGAGRRFDLVAARANGQPAFGAYLRAPDGIRHGSGLYVLTLTGDQICAMTRFDNSVLPWFGLPRSLPTLRHDSDAIGRPIRHGQMAPRHPQGPGPA
jgi:SnoaL-like domain